MNDEFKNLAIQQCLRSAYKYRVGAIVVFKGKVVGKGFNKVHSTGVPKLDGKHAELEAINNTTARFRKGCTVYVCRLTKSNELALAKPCEACQVVMKKMGVKYVWYSSAQGWVRMVM